MDNIGAIWINIPAAAALVSGGTQTPGQRVARPAPADTLAYTSKTTASFVHVSLDAIKDQVVPANSADSSSLQLDFWPHKGTTEWLLFEWDTEQRISSLKAYWLDDTGRGGRGRLQSN